MPDTYAAEVESMPIAIHSILWVSVVFLVVALVWANFAMLDEVAHADGRVIPSGQVQVIQNLEGGILAEVMVMPGDQVTKDQSLLRMDDTRFASSFNEGKVTLQALQAIAARLQAEISGDTFIVPEKRRVTLLRSRRIKGASGFPDAPFLCLRLAERQTPTEKRSGDLHVLPGRRHP